MAYHRLSKKATQLRSSDGAGTAGSSEIVKRTMPQCRWPEAEGDRHDRNTSGAFLSEVSHPKKGRDVDMLAHIEAQEVSVNVGVGARE